MDALQTKAELTCPFCHSVQEVEMPLHACQHFYVCSRCGQMLKPKEGDCCVFCSYANRKCPPQQEEALGKR